MRSTLFRILIAGLFASFFSTVEAQSPPKLQITHLTGDFYVYTTYQEIDGNPFPANGLFLLTNAGAVMIDTPWDSTQFDALLDSITIGYQRRVTMCISTHFHNDRTGGLSYYKSKGIRTYTSRMTDSLSQMHHEPRAEYVFTKDTVFKVGQYTFQTFYGGPGHSPDNIVIWFGAEKILYGGCLIKSMDAGTLGNMSDANVQAWPQTIKKIRKKFGKPRFIIPGHQSWNNTAALEHTLELLKEEATKQ